MVGENNFEPLCPLRYYLYHDPAYGIGK